MQPSFIPSPTPCLLTHTNIHSCIIINAHFHIFNTSVTNGPMDDKASYRSACPLLKITEKNPEKTVVERKNRRKLVVIENPSHSQPYEGGYVCLPVGLSVSYLTFSLMICPSVCICLCVCLFVCLSSAWCHTSCITLAMGFQC